MGGSTATGTASGDNAAACASGLQQELADQQKVSQDQQQVAQDESKLAKDLSAAGNAAGKSEPASNGAGQNPAGQGSASTSGASLASSVATPYQLAADQATLDADEAQLSEAQANLDEGQLVSPIDGVVASVGVSVGQTISADSSADQIVVIGPQTFQVTTPVGVSDLSDVHVGATAMVVPNGQSGSLRGQVTEVGPPPTSTSSTSYPVVVSVPAGSAGLYDGATTNVSIVVGQASNVVTVPTSAVHVLGRVAFVSELRNGSVVTVPVTTGLIGDTVTQLTTGLKPGAVVVLADLSEPLPTSTGLSGVGALLGGGGRVRFAPGGVGGAVPSGSVSITGKSS
jgi:multidrug efflux pump subunit AcrA (membrane-fusion protein)